MKRQYKNSSKINLTEKDVFNVAFEDTLILMHP